MGCGLLVATGFAAASALTQKVAAAEQASSFDVKPSWSSGTSRVQAGSPFVATLAPTTAKRCDVTIDGPQKGQLLRWTLQTSGTPIRLTLPTDPAATPGRWLVLASCVQRDDARQLTARMSLHLLGAGGRHLIGRHGALRKVVLTPHAQALVSSARHARVKVVAVVVKYGQSDLVGDDYPAAWRARRRDSVLDDWGNYNRESTSFVAWALASRNGFRMPFHSNAIAWAPLARKRGYTVDRHPAPGSVAYWGVGLGHVAYVRSVSGKAVQVEDYSWFGDGGRFGSRTVPASAFTSFIHFKDLATVPAPSPTSTGGTEPPTTGAGGGSSPGSTTSRTTTSQTTTTGTTTTTSRGGGGGGGGGGGSSATCSPSPCTQGTAVSHTITVADSDGADAKNATMTYKIERPNGLTNSSSNPAPLLVVFADQASDDSNFQALSATDRYVLLYIPQSHGGQYGDPVVSPTPSTQAPKTCGVSGTNNCDDIPWLQAVLQHTVCSGGSPCENIDPNKVYAAGASKGGLMTMAAVCDTRTSSYFHAAWVVSWLLTSPTVNSQTAAANCPAILGTSMPWSGGSWGGPAGLGANTNISIGFEGGDADGLACTAGLPSTCFDTGGYDSSSRWWWSVWQLAGAGGPPSPGTSAGSGVMFGTRLGCSGNPSTNTIYGAGNLLHKTIYTGCAHSNRATEALMVHTGGHAWAGLDGKGGLDSAAEAWNFFTSYGGH